MASINLYSKEQIDTMMQGAGGWDYIETSVTDFFDEVYDTLSVNDEIEIMIRQFNTSGECCYLRLIGKIWNIASNIVYIRGVGVIDYFDNSTVSDTADSGWNIGLIHSMHIQNVGNRAITWTGFPSNGNVNRNVDAVNSNNVTVYLKILE